MKNRGLGRREAMKNLKKEESGLVSKSVNWRTSRGNINIRCIYSWNSLLSKILIFVCIKIGDNHAILQFKCCCNLLVCLHTKVWSRESQNSTCNTAQAFSFHKLKIYLLEQDSCSDHTCRGEGKSETQSNRYTCIDAQEVYTGDETNLSS